MIGLRAPGRVNLIGDHTDYNDGFCLPLAIDRECVVTGSPRTDGRVTIRSRAGRRDRATWPRTGATDPARVEPAWGRFVAGVVRALGRLGRAPVGFDGMVTSTVPTGSGLSSSSALSVALTLALAEAGGLDSAERRATWLGPRSPPRCSRPGCRAGSWTRWRRCSASPTTRCSSTAARSKSLRLRSPALTRCSSSTPASRAPLSAARTPQRREACEAAAAKRLGVAALRDATLDQVTRRSVRSPRRHREPACARLRTRHWRTTT